jgi:hypothetical protein
MKPRQLHTRNLSRPKLLPLDRRGIDIALSNCILKTLGFQNAFVVNPKRCTMAIQHVASGPFTRFPMLDCWIHLDNETMDMEHVPAR